MMGDQRCHHWCCTFKSFGHVHKPKGGGTYFVTEQPLQNSTIAHATVDLSQIPWPRTVHKCTRIHLHIAHIRTQVRTFRKWLRLSCDSPCLHVTVVCMSQWSASHSWVHVTVVCMSQLCACYSCPHVTVVYSTPAHMPKNFHDTPAMHSCIPAPPQGSVHLQWAGSWMASYIPYIHWWSIVKHCSTWTGMHSEYFKLRLHIQPHTLA